MFPATAAIRSALGSAAVPAQPSPLLHSPATLANQNHYCRALQAHTGALTLWTVGTPTPSDTSKLRLAEPEVINDAA